MSESKVTYYLSFLTLTSVVLISLKLIYTSGSEAGTIKTFFKPRHKIALVSKICPRTEIWIHSGIKKPITISHRERGSLLFKMQDPVDGLCLPQERHFILVNGE